MNELSKFNVQESPSGLSTKERDDAYHAVVHMAGNWRIIICKGQLQWIIQRAKKAGTERRWYGVSYVTSKRTLIDLWSHKTDSSTQPLTGLPDTCRGDSE